MAHKYDDRLYFIYAVVLIILVAFILSMNFTGVDPIKKETSLKPLKPPIYHTDTQLNKPYLHKNEITIYSSYNSFLKS